MTNICVPIDYARHRHSIRQGDVFAFGGRGWFSRIIKAGTCSRVSHVGMVLRTDEHDLVMLIESTTLHDGKSGVQVNALSSVVAGYNGDVWHLPLTDANSKRVAHSDFFTYMRKQVGKRYDMKQAILSAIPLYGRQNSDRAFCSELVGLGLRRADIFHEDTNTSELTPVDIARAKIYKPRYYELTGSGRRIKSFNSYPP